MRDSLWSVKVSRSPTEAEDAPPSETCTLPALLVNTSASMEMFPGLPLSHMLPLA